MVLMKVQMAFIVEDRWSIEKLTEGFNTWLTKEDLEKILKEYPNSGHITSCMGVMFHGISTMTDFNNYLYGREVNVEASIEPSKNLSKMNFSSSWHVEHPSKFS